MPQISGKKLCKIVEKLDFKNIHVRGSHHIYKHVDGRKTTIPVHGNESIGQGLLLKIIKQDLRITREEFKKNL